MARRDNPARLAVTTPPVPVRVSADDITSARERFRKHAPRRAWGLTEARAITTRTTTPARRTR